MMTSCFFCASAEPADTVSAAAAKTSAAFLMIFLPFALGPRVTPTRSL